MKLKPRKKPAPLISQDLEMTMKCARLMGLNYSLFQGKLMARSYSKLDGRPHAYHYQPLVDAKQAFELVEKLYLDIRFTSTSTDKNVWLAEFQEKVHGVHADLKRAIVLCCSNI